MPRPRLGRFRNVRPVAASAGAGGSVGDMEGDVHVDTCILPAGLGEGQGETGLSRSIAEWLHIDGEVKVEGCRRSSGM